MTAGLLAFVALVVAVAAPLCGHQGQPWPLGGAWRWLYGRLRHEVPVEAHRLPDIRERPAQSRLWLRSARVVQPEPPATGPSRPQGSRWSAPHGAGGGFPARGLLRAAERRTALRESGVAA